LNYYLSNFFALSELYNPGNLFVTNYQCIDDVGLGDDNWDHQHILEITYGLGVTGPEPPIDPPPIP
jgi:hypothetical protein